MKKLKTFVFLSLLLTGCKNSLPSSSEKDSIATEEKISNKVQVVLMYGQSNMEGHTHKEYLVSTMGKEKTKEYIDGYEDVKISYACTITQNTSNKEFVPVKLGQGYMTDRFGPEIGMAEYFHNQNLETPVYLIKFAQGATSLYNSWRSPTSGMTGSLYRFAMDYTIEQLQKLESMDLYPEVKAICWMQGEDDSSSNFYQNYYNYETALIEDMREELNYYASPDGIGFVDAGISDCSAWTHHVEINDAKKQLAEDDQNHIYFGTIDEKLEYNKEPMGNPDIYHYDSSSMIKLGKVFAEKVAENFLEK